MWIDYQAARASASEHYFIHVITECKRCIVKQNTIKLSGTNVGGFVVLNI